MSVAVGLEAEGGVWLAWDSAITCDDGEQSLVANKGFMLGGVGFAFVGSRHDQIVRHYLEVQPRDCHPEEWGVTALASTIGTLLAEASVEGDWNALVAVDGVLLRLDNDLSCYRPLRYGYAAIGSGSSYALGALAATEGCGAQWRAESAVLAACRHHVTVSEPVHTLWVPA